MTRWGERQSMCARCQAQNRQGRRFQPQNAFQTQQMPAYMSMHSSQVKNPDITFEPLDASSSAQVQPVSPYAAALAELAQDERNGAVFYSYLADAASSEWDRELLLELSENSLARSENAAALVRESGGSCETKVNVVTEHIRYGDGVVIAVRQESRLIDGLAALLEQTGEDRTARGVQVLLARKISDYGKLQLLR